MRVANILEEGKMGGPQVRILQVAVYLEKHVDTVVVMPEENSAEFQQCCESLGVPFQALPLSRITKELGPALRYLWRTPWEILQLVRLFHQERFDLIHVSGGSWQYKGTIAGKLAGTPVIWHLNDTYMPRPLRRVFGLLSGLACGYAYASERTKAYYAPYVSSNKFEFTIPAPVDTTRFDPKLELPDDALYSELEGRKVVGTVANPSPVKDLMTFLKMAEKVQKQTAMPVVFVVVGKLYETQMNYFHTLQEMTKELQLKIYWAGPRQDVRPLLKRFDVYVCSSKAESSPISVWEAMSMSKPIVSTDVGDVPIYVHDQENGFIVPAGDADQLAACVQRLLDSESMRKSFGKKSRWIAQQKLDISFCGQKHFEAYQQITSQS
jgi:glycosyltransferase involved in cell wall biosynthesis